MKNIHVLPTDKPSNLLLCIKDYTEHKDTPAENSDTKGNFRLGLGIYANTEVYQYKNIYITSDEEIKEYDYFLNTINNAVLTNLNVIKSKRLKKIILTTDKDLIKDGVQAIDDEFLEWFVKNPSCEEVEVLFACRGLDGNTPIGEYRIIIPKEEPKYISIIEKMKPLQEQWQKDMDESLKPKQETLEEYIERETKGLIEPNLKAAAKAFIRYGAKWQAEKTCESEFIQLIRATKSDAEARRIIREYFK